MQRYWQVTGGLLFVFLALFAVVKSLNLPLLEDPARWLAGGGPAAAAVSVGLLIADVVLPVPSSILMLGNGAMFGVVVGTALSLAGSLGATALGFLLGRRGSALIGRLVTPAEKVRADRLLARWGALAIVVTRPIPLLAETTAILAGASPLGWGKMLLAAVGGALPSALLYA